MCQPCKITHPGRFRSSSHRSAHRPRRAGAPCQSLRGRRASFAGFERLDRCRNEHEAIERKRVERVARREKMSVMGWIEAPPEEPDPQGSALGRFELHWRHRVGLDRGDDRRRPRTPSVRPGRSETAAESGRRGPRHRHGIERTCTTPRAEARHRRAAGVVAYFGEHVLEVDDAASRSTFPAEIEHRRPRSP